MMIRFILIYFLFILAKGRTNFEIRDQFIMRDSLSQQVSLFSRPRSPSRGSICTPNQNQSQIKVSI